MSNTVKLAKYVSENVFLDEIKFSRSSISDFLMITTFYKTENGSFVYGKQIPFYLYDDFKGRFTTLSGTRFNKLFYQELNASVSDYILNEKQKPNNTHKFLEVVIKRFTA